MADLTITAANVVAGTGAAVEPGFAGATITAGQVVYKESATGLFKLADCNSATAEARVPYGIALNGASTGQSVSVLTSGNVTIGATIAAGVAYYLSGTAGGIRPVADNVSGDYPSVIGFGISTTVMKVAITSAGVPI